MRRPWLLAVAALLAVALTARLGLWQLDRARQKTELGAQIEGRGRLAPLPNEQLARDAATAAQQHFRRIRLQGEWLAGHTVFLDNRQQAGRAGFIAVTPLRLADGTAVLVQRGWAPRHFTDRQAVPALDTPPGTVQLEARIAPPPSKLFELGGAESGPIRQNLDVSAFALETGLRLRPLSLQQLEPAGSPAPDGLWRQWPLPTVDVGKHHGYAFQWFALSALITGLFVWFQVLRPRLHRGRPPSADPRANPSSHG